jgi:hypothetical protein
MSNISTPESPPGARPTPDLQQLRVPQHTIDVGTDGDNGDDHRFEVPMNEGNVTKEETLHAFCVDLSAVFRNIGV